MKEILEIFAKWEPIGQALFILIILSGVFTFISGLILGTLRYITIIVRGWPVHEYESDDESDDDEYEHDEDEPRNQRESMVR